MTVFVYKPNHLATLSKIDLLKTKDLLFSSYQLNAHFLYSITIYEYMLHYNPQHVSTSTLLIFKTSGLLKMSKVLLETC